VQKRWLSDDRNNGAPAKEDVDQVGDDWRRQTFEANWKFWAIVQPKRVIAQMNMDEFKKMAEAGGLTVRTFEDPDDAMKWLEAQ
jgi:hypothetical protein